MANRSIFSEEASGIMSGITFSESDLNVISEISEAISRRDYSKLKSISSKVLPEDIIWDGINSTEEIILPLKHDFYKNVRKMELDNGDVELWIPMRTNINDVSDIVLILIQRSFANSGFEIDNIYQS
jgi:hypothetical protein